MGKYHDRINWKKELQLLPGYIIVCAWVALTAAILFWIVCASLSSTKEILTGRVMDFSNGLKWDNYVTAWNTQNVSLYFFNSLVYAIVSCVGVLLISAPGAYVLSRWKFVGGKAIRIGLVIAMSVPTIMIIMPLYSLAVQWASRGACCWLCCTLCCAYRIPRFTYWISSPHCPGLMRRRPTLTDAAILGRSGRLCCRWFSPPLLRLRFSTSCLCGTSSSWR